MKCAAVRVATALVVASTALLSAPPLGAQDRDAPLDSGKADKTFFTRSDLLYTGLAIAGSAAISHFDVRIAHWAQTPNVQGSQSRRDLVDGLTRFNETPLAIGAILTYGVGRLGRWNTVTDVGLHTTEALLLTDVVSELIRGPVGRARPRVSPDDAFQFEFGKGFTDFANRAFPSLHAASAFAAAAALTEEVHERKPAAAWFVGPVLYGAAMIPGMTRIYLNQHWASDVASGAFAGTLLGVKVVHYAHTHRRTRLDRFLMGAVIVPTADGGVYVGATLNR